MDERGLALQHLRDLQLAEGGENSPLSYGTADRIRRRRDYNFQGEGLLEAFSKEQVPVNSIASFESLSPNIFATFFQEFLLFNTSFLIGRSRSWITRREGYWFRCDSICIRVYRGRLPRYGQCEPRIAVLIVREVVADVAARVRRGKGALFWAWKFVGSKVLWFKVVAG